MPRRSRRLAQAQAVHVQAVQRDDAESKDVDPGTHSDHVESISKRRRSAQSTANDKPPPRKKAKSSTSTKSATTAPKVTPKVTPKATRKASRMKNDVNDHTTLPLPLVQVTTAPKRLVVTLPRTMEESIRADSSLSIPIRFVIGIDEAGRGPLAGPVVAAAICVPPHATSVAGVVDSKQITHEATRDDVYHQTIATPGVAWAVAVIDSTTIDSINILQATLLGMKRAAAAVIGAPIDCQVVDRADISVDGCYVVRGGASPLFKSVNDVEPPCVEHCYALIDGNRLPDAMPCQSQTVIKGDGREYCIAAASILAKVTRDRLMHAYDALYPLYQLAQHKGYPTAQHRAAVQKYGATPIHRRTFAPLKHMVLDPMTGHVVLDELDSK